MAHLEQINFCKEVKYFLPKYFKNKDVLDVGCMDINGNNRYLFDNCNYYGIDLGDGNNVDEVCHVTKFNKGCQYDVIISTEALEHDKYYRESLMKMYDLLRPDGLLIITCGTFERAEHGTHHRSAHASPHTLDDYNNITNEMFFNSLDIGKFRQVKFNNDLYDLQFAGVKAI